jgi:hypothetical protein
MFVPSTIAAYAIFKVKRWSIPVVLICIFWLASCMIFLNSGSTISSILLTIVLPVIINVLIVLHLLTPRIQIFYKDSKLRWWEREKRYQYSAPINIQFSDQTLRGQLLNISKGGCLIESDKEFPIGSLIKIRASTLVGEVELNSRITFNKKDYLWKHGVQFVENDQENFKTLLNLIKKLKNSKTPISNPPPYWKDDLKQWVKELLK